MLRLEARPKNIEGEGEIAIRELVRNSLRMRPDRIIVGEVRGAEALDMLQAMNTGHDGSLCTVHANAPRDALARIETMVLMAGYDLPVRAIRQQVASALDLIVHLERLEDGSRRVTAITEVQRMESDVITLQDIFEFKVEQVTADRVVIGSCARPACGRRSCTSSRSTASRCRRASSATRGRTSPRLRGGRTVRAVRFVLASAAVVAAAAALVSAATAATDLPLRELGGARFPDRAFLLSLPEPVALGPEEVTVRENGEPVEGLTVLPASAAGAGEFAVVLVIDASESMRGDAIEGALDAARAFAETRGSEPGDRRARVQRAVERRAPAHDERGGDPGGARVHAGARERDAHS